jgi:hypothetical protein
MRNGLSTIAMLWVTLCLAAPSFAFAADGNSHDRTAQLKAAYLLNFVKFVQWPSVRPEDTITVCFFGRGNVQNVFAISSEGKKIGGHGIVIRTLDATHATHGTLGCSVLYIDAQDDSVGNRPPTPDSNVPVLTVSDASGFTRAGGMIELFTSNNRLHFNINVETARRAGLSISSSLLQLASSVEKGAAP